MEQNSRCHLRLFFFLLFSDIIWTKRLNEKESTNSLMMEIISPTNIWLALLSFLAHQSCWWKRWKINITITGVRCTWWFDSGPFRSESAWEGKEKVRNWSRVRAQTQTTAIHGIMCIQLFIHNIYMYHVYLLPLTAAYLTCALQWWISPYFLHLYWLWHPDICNRKTHR